MLFLEGTASPAKHTRIIGSPYTLHWSPSEDHRPTWMLGGEKEYAGGLVLGAAFFSNSFGQESATVYRGRRLTGWSAYDKLYFQWTAGLMYGYKPPYDDEVPVNIRGLSPVAVLSLGWQFTPKYAMQLNALGTAAVMFQFSVELD
ncbi:MAG: hypothetical protein AD742_12865 [Methylibium sp. NZG]|nr:MAG: hypothetical protein AD742_12865 [Methylibium sp. NZG]